MGAPAHRPAPKRVARSSAGIEIPSPNVDLDEGIMRTGDYYRNQFEADALARPVMPGFGEPVR